MLAKHGKLGTRGLRVMRGTAKTCKSTTCNIQLAVPFQFFKFCWLIGKETKYYFLRPAKSHAFLEYS